MSIHEGKKLSDYSVTERMRNNLRPKGSAGVVQLHLVNHGIFNFDFIDKCITELEKMPMRAVCGEPPTHLERLAYILLCDSAYIDL